MIRFVFTFFIVTLLTACSVNPSNHILWSNQNLTSAQAYQNDDMFTLRTLNIPKYLERQELVIKPKTGITYIQFLSEYKWEESLDSNLRRVISQNLNHLLKAPMVYSKPHFNMPNTHIIDLDVFEWVIDEKQSHLLLTSVWQLTDKDDQSSQRYELKKTYPINLETPYQWADAYQKAADDLSVAIFETL